MVSGDISSEIAKLHIECGGQTNEYHRFGYRGIRSEGKDRPVMTWEFLLKEMTLRLMLFLIN